MTISRSSPAKLQVFVTNGRDVDFSVLSEPWAHQLTLRPGEKLRIESDSIELQDLDNPLNFEIWDDGSGVSIWCPPSAVLIVIGKDSDA